MSISTYTKQRILIYPLFFFFLFLGFNANSQSISFRLNKLSSNSSFEKLIDDSLLVTPEGLVDQSGYDFDFTFRFKSIKSVQPYLRFGTLYTFNEQTSLSFSNNSNAKTENYLLQEFRNHSFSTGILTKLINKDKFTLLGNMEFLFSFSTKNFTETKVMQFNSSGELDDTYLSINNEVKPMGIEFGLGLRFEYLVIKNLGLYFDVNYKYGYRWSKGIKNIQYEIINNENEITFESNVLSEERDTQLYQYLPTAIGITWYLPSRKEKNK